MTDADYLVEELGRLVERLGIEKPPQRVAAGLGHLLLVPILHALLDRIEGLERKG